MSSNARPLRYVVGYDVIYEPHESDRSEWLRTKFRLLPNAVTQRFPDVDEMLDFVLTHPGPIHFIYRVVEEFDSMNSEMMRLLHRARQQD